MARNIKAEDIKAAITILPSPQEAAVVTKAAAVVTKVAVVATKVAVTRFVDSD